MQTYRYTLDSTCNVLNDILQLNDTLRPLVSNVMVRKNIDGSVPENNVMVTTNVVLNSDQEDILIAIINGYNMNPLKMRNMLETNVMGPAMSFGMEFLKRFSANNLYLEKTDVQIGALLNTYPDLIHACITGSLKSLYATMLSMTADENISQGEIDEFKKRVEIYLGLA